MDIQKEREAFEDWIKNEDPFAGNDANPDCIWAKKYMWKAWQAKAQAVPDGFVVVPKEPTREILIAADNCAIDGKVTANNIYKAMLAAQEPK